MDLAKRSKLVVMQIGSELADMYASAQCNGDDRVNLSWSDIEKIEAGLIYLDRLITTHIETLELLNTEVRGRA